MTSYASGSFLTTWNWSGGVSPTAPTAPASAPLPAAEAAKVSKGQVLVPRSRGPKLTEAQKSAFFDEMRRNGGNATKAALALGLSGGHGRKLALKAKAMEPAKSLQESINEDMIAAAHEVNELARKATPKPPAPEPESPPPKLKQDPARVAVEAAIDGMQDDAEELDDEEDDEPDSRGSTREREMRLINKLIKEAESRHPLKITTKPYSRHFVIPDVQLKPGDDVAFLRRIGHEIVAQLPDAIICLGDFTDMESLCPHDKNKQASIGRSYYADCAIAREGMASLMGPIIEENARRAAAGLPLYEPEMIFCLGNHEFRIERERSKVSGKNSTYQMSDLGYAEWGWKVYAFLEVVIVDGIAYSHYHTSGPMGRPIPSARLVLQKKHQSCVQGHSQFDQIYSEYNASGRRLTALIAGCCYEVDLPFLGPQGNFYFRGVYALNEVKNGEFYMNQISLAELKRRYPQPQHPQPQAPVGARRRQNEKPL